MHAPEARGRLAVDGRLRVVGAPGTVALGNRPGHSARTWLGLGLELGLGLKVRASVVLCVLKLLLMNRLGGAWGDARGRDGA